MARFHSLCCRLCFLWVVGHVHRNLYIHAFAPPLSSFVRNYARTQSFDDNFASFADNTIKHTSVVYLSPSGIDEWPQISQAVVFFSTYVALTITTIPTINLIENISKTIGMEQWRRNIIDTSLPILLGLFYTSAGIGHFANKSAFLDIYPPIGTWGLWYVPGSPEFHVAWTGIVELLGGSGLLIGVLRDMLDIEEDGWMNFIQPLSASVLFVLTVVVTPANIYMFTHGAVMGDMEPLGLSFHAVRFGVQVLLFSLLVTLARDGFFFAWGEELD